MVTELVVPLSTDPPLFFVVTAEVELPAVAVLVSPVTLIDTAVPAPTETGLVTVYVRVLPANATVPALIPVTVPTAGVPAVPDATVIVTDVNVAVVAVVNVNV
jgi:hypothetical protein